MGRLPYELLAAIFKIYVSLPHTSPETLLQVCCNWSAVASHEPALWTKFVVSEVMIKSDTSGGIFWWKPEGTLTRDWVDVFKRRLARAGQLPLQVFILDLRGILRPVVDVISGGAPDYVHLTRWETFNLESCGLIDSYSYVANLISQPMPSLKRLTIKRNKIDFHAFPSAPNLEELNVLFNRSPHIGQDSSFPILKKLRIAYPTKYPLSSLQLSKFSLRTLETLIIGGEVDVNSSLKGTYPSLSMLEFTARVPQGIVYMSAPSLRHLVLREANLCCRTNLLDGESQYAKNRNVVEMLARTFPTVEVLEIHEKLKGLVLEMIFACNQKKIVGIKELWAISEHGRQRIDFM